MKRNQLLIVILLNLFIAVGFFIENKGSGFSQLSSDLHNSIPVCYKIDNPALFQKDLYLYDVNNVKYYTPFYIETVRFFARCAGGDYLSGINVFAMLLHFVYGLTWFFLLYKILRRFSTALFLSILIRGILWLPGLEIWGISDIWTMMPRTMYAALMPIPFILLLNQSKKSFYFACFLIGFIFNFHPITGMGGLLIFALVVLAYPVLYSGKISWPTVGLGMALIILGMLPFLSTYFLETKSSAVYDVALYKKAFFARIPEFFADPPAFLRYWIKPTMLVFALPLGGYYLFAQFFDRRHLRNAVLLLSISLLTIAIFSVSVYVENAVNTIFNLNLRMSFQIIRAQKLAVLPGFIALGFLLNIALEKSRIFQKLFVYGLPLFIVALFFSKLPIFNKIPFFSDDISRSIFPDYRQFFLSDQEKQIPLDRMIDYINIHTQPSDVFYGKYLVRSACRRSVVMDEKGASMLIEGNPIELIKWYQEMEYMKTLSESEKLDYLKNVKSVSYILTEDVMAGNVTLIHREGNNHLYKIQ